MKPVKKVLLAHVDERLRRLITMLLAGAGYDVRPVKDDASALELASREWFDLVLLDDRLASPGDFGLLQSFRRIQPTAPLVLLVWDVELDVVIKSIRLGLTDVVAVDQDELRPFLQRVITLLEPGCPVDPHGLSVEELDEAESVLATLGESDVGADHVDNSQDALKRELLRVMRERDDLEQRLDRMHLEKQAAERELRFILQQSHEGMRLQSELVDLQSEREMARAAQETIDAKARQLADLREQLARERNELEQIRAEASPASESAESAHERETLEDWRADLLMQQADLTERESRLRAETVQLANERRRWHDELVAMSEQEKNLVAYEERLRKMQDKLESDRVLWFSHARSPQLQNPVPLEQSEYKAAWQKLQRAHELLEAERSALRDDLMSFREHEADVKRREERLQSEEQRIKALLAVTADIPAKPEPRGFTRSLWPKAK